VLELLLAGAQGSVNAIAQEHGLLQGKVLGDDTLREGLSAIIQSHPKQLAKYLEGQHGVQGFFVGQAMKEYGMGAADGQGRPVVMRWHCVGQSSSAKQLGQLITELLDGNIRCK